MNKIVKSTFGAAIIFTIAFGFFSNRASASSLSYTLSLSPNCALLIDGSSTLKATATSGSSSNVTVWNSDLYVEIDVSGPGVPANTRLQTNNKISTINSLTFQLGNVTSQQILTFIPVATDSPTINCPDGSTATAGRLIINSVAPASQTPAVTKPKTPPSTPAVSTPAPTNKAAVQLTTAIVAGKTISTDKTFTVAYNEEIKLSGTTVANGLVNITTHSTPKTAKVMADTKGLWTYTVSELEPGTHIVEANVTDPITKIVSSTTNLLSFIVTEPASQPISKTVAKKSNNTLIFIIIGVLALVSLIIAAFVLLRKNKLKKNKKKINPQTEVISPESDTINPGSI